MTKYTLEMIEKEIETVKSLSAEHKGEKYRKYLQGLLTIKEGLEEKEK